MLDASKGDNFRDGIQNIDIRLQVGHAQYAPFGPEFPMMLLELCLCDVTKSVILGGLVFGPMRA